MIIKQLEIMSSARERRLFLAQIPAIGTGTAAEAATALLLPGKRSAPKAGRAFGERKEDF